MGVIEELRIVHVEVYKMKIKQRRAYGVWYIQIVIPWLWVRAMTLWPVVLMKEDYSHTRTERHEVIHILQQRELLVIPFYVLYFLNWLLNIPVHWGGAYRNICFEREAYACDDIEIYLFLRKRFAWVDYIIN